LSADADVLSCQGVDTGRTQLSGRAGVLGKESSEFAHFWDTHGQAGAGCSTEGHAGGSDIDSLRGEHAIGDTIATVRAGIDHGFEEFRDEFI
jgi:hypothetical protein